MLDMLVMGLSPLHRRLLFGSKAAFERLYLVQHDILSLIIHCAN